jgi:hypothetical protein
MKIEDFKDSPPCIELPEEKWRELEVTLGVAEPNLAIRRDIARYVERHLFSAELDLPKKRNGAQRKWVTRIRKKAQHLTDVLDWAASADESDDRWAQMYAVYDLLSRNEQEGLLASLKSMLASADDMLARLPKGKGGRDVDDFAWGLVFDLAFLYEWATGQRPTITYNDYGHPDSDYDEDGNVGIYEGPFLDFVAAVLRVFAPDRAKGNTALGKHIVRVLKAWRRRNELRTKLRLNL